jgi:hypothetical protein
MGQKGWLKAEDRGSRFLQNVGIHLQVHMPSHLRRPPWTMIEHVIHFTYGMSQKIYIYNQNSPKVYPVCCSVLLKLLLYLVKHHQTVKI